MKKLIERYLGWCTKRTIERDRPMIVAIGGSVGKTSARHAFTILMQGCPSIGSFRTSRKNFNNEIGVPLSVFGCELPGKNPVRWLCLLSRATFHAFGLMKLDLKYLVLEMGTDRPGDMAYLLSIAPPQAVVLTAMGAEHIENFGSIESAIEEERTMLHALPENGEVVLNADDPYVWSSKSILKAEPIGFGKSAEAVVRIAETKVHYDPDHPEENGLDVTYDILRHHHKTIRLHGVFGEPHAYAVASVLGFLISMDHSMERALNFADEHYYGIPGRTRLIPGIKRTILLDDSYNAQPQAMKSAVNDLARFPVQENGRRIAVLGDMLELGEISDYEHEQIGKQVAEANIDILVTCGTLARTIAASAKAVGMNPEKIHQFDTSAEAGLFLQQEIIQPGDAILIKGSQGIRMERITKELMAEPMRAEELLVRHTPDWLKRT